MSQTSLRSLGTTDTGRRRRWPLWLLGALMLVAGGALAGWSWWTSQEVVVPDLEIAGLDDDVLLSGEDLAETEVVVHTDAELETVTATLDGDPVGRIDGDRYVIDDLDGLDDGEHTIEVSAGVDERFSDVSTAAVSFSLDTTPPTLELPEVVEAGGRNEPLAVDFTADGASEVTAGGDATVEWADGSGTVSYESTPTEVTLAAVDEAGNEATAEAMVIVEFPGGRAVHTTPSAWQYEPKRTAVIDMIEAGLIDAVELDIKDELGDISYDSDVELANLSGADAKHSGFDAAAAVQQIHDLGARVIGRLVVYKDPALAQWAWNNDRRDMVIQTTDGQPFTGSYGEFAFTNFANPDVQQYNIDIALEAAELGFDDILYDYIRRPDGSLDSMVFPGIGDRTPEEAVVEMMADAYPLLADEGVWVGASVFGIAVTRPKEIAQDITLMAEHADYIAPMVYPNHWGPGEYDLASPVDSPYEIVQRSLADFQEAVAGTDTVIMPWLQDFGGYGDAEVRAQIDATVDATGEEWFLLWNASANYHPGALEPIDPDGP